MNQQYYNYQVLTTQENTNSKLSEEESLKNDSTTPDDSPQFLEVISQMCKNLWQEDLIVPQNLLDQDQQQSKNQLNNCNKGIVFKPRINQAHNYKIISKVLQDILDMNFKNDTAEKCGFITDKNDMVEVNDYLDQIDKYIEIPESQYIIALIQIDRYVKLQSKKITTENIQRLLITALLITEKYYNDFAPKDILVQFAFIGNISEKTLKKLEWQMLEQLDFKLEVSEDYYNSYKQRLNKYNNKI